MRRALLLVDRGSREPEVRQELDEICAIAKNLGGYDYANYCFLEVLPPYIPEGIGGCIENRADCITLMPYFLYPGMKLKDTVKKSAQIGRERKLKIAITKPLCYHPMMTGLIVDRVTEAKQKNGISQSDDQCDILIIGHGSSDRNAHDAFIHAVDSTKVRYRKVQHCFLELDKPGIEEGISQAISNNPMVLLMMPYFLHRGAHVKKDIANEVSAALSRHEFKNAFMCRHLGVDDKLVQLVIERAKEVEKRAGIQSQ
ncbi:MAG TPA: CbiX/SirB N-terminal domain-containing protein [Nitrososphaera sp.]